MVRIPPGLWQLEGQKKKFFAKESVAKAYKDRLTRLTVNYQLQAAALSDTQRMEAFECFAKLEPLGASLRSAVDHYVAYLEKAGKSISVRDFFPEFLANKEQDGVSRRYIADLRSKLGRFAGEFGKRLMCDITSQELDSWLRSLDVNVTSRDAYRRNVGVMFEMARQRGYCTQNPAADIRFKHRLKGEVTILAAGQLRQLSDQHDRRPALFHPFRQIPPEDREGELGAWEYPYHPLMRNNGSKGALSFKKVSCF
jgi:hypothetical protein